MAKKRIVLLNYNLTVIGGVSRVASLMVAQLHDDCEVHLISMTGQGNNPFSLPQDAQFTVLLPGNVRIRHVIQRGTGLLRHYLQENNIQAVIILGDWCGIAALLATRACKIPLVVCDHGTLSSNTLSRYTQIETWLEYRYCSRVVVLTEKAVEILLEKCPAAANKIVCIPNCVDVPPLPAPLPTGKAELVTLTRLAGDKGLPYMLQEACALKQRLPDFVWRVYGNGEQREWLESEIKKNHLSENLLLMGTTGDPAAAYRSAVAAVLTTSHEGLPMMLLEAKAQGRPLAAFDIPCGPSDLIRDGVDGFLLPFGDFEAMADRLALILTDRAMAEKMAQNARSNLQPYYPDNVRAKWLALINSIT